MNCYKISSQSDVSRWIKRVGSTKEGNTIMAKKGKLSLFFVNQIKSPAANILKQEALSVGAEFATDKEVIVCGKQNVDGLLICSIIQLEILVNKLKQQPFGLKELASKLSSFIKLPKFQPKIMGVLNTNEDSFFSGSRFVGSAALKRIEQMIEDGADIIDVGGVSSRPGSEGVSEEEEFKRVSPVIDAIYKNNLHVKTTFSLDSYSPYCLEYALNKGFTLVNDITALNDDEVAKVSAKYKATVCLMHMQNDPKTMQQEPHYNDVMSEVDNFFTCKIEKAKSFGIKDIVLDVGIGFGKTLEHNMTLIKHHEHFLHFGYELLVGASRKSMIDAIVPASVDERLPGTLAIHLEALKNGASIIRCHDVKEHKQALAVWRALNKEVL